MKNNKLFEGVSDKGSIQEALNNAIERAKENLKTESVQWELQSLKGRDGGFVPMHHLTLTINAKAGA
jgi:flavin-binding protein dodecin